MGYWGSISEINQSSTKVLQKLFYSSLNGVAPVILKVTAIPHMAHDRQTERAYTGTWRYYFFSCNEKKITYLYLYRMQIGGHFVFFKRPVISIWFFSAWNSAIIKIFLRSSSSSSRSFNILANEKFNTLRLQLIKIYPHSPFAKNG